MKQFFKTTWKLIRKTTKKFSKEDPVVYAAAIAFFTIFSLPSVLIIIVRGIGTFVGTEKVRNEVGIQIEGMVGADTASQVDKIIENVSQFEDNVWLNIIGLVFLFISATAMFNFIQKALNSIWGVKPKPNKEVLKFLKDRLLSFLLIVVFGFLILISFLIDAVLGIFNDFISQLLSGLTYYVMLGLNYLITLSVVTLVFGLIFKFLPDANIRWKDVSVGALVTGILFTIGKALFGIVLSQTDIASTYGAAGSLAAILFWVFYSSIILMIGAVFTQVYASSIGRHILPNRHSVKVEVQEVEVEGKK